MKRNVFLEKAGFRYIVNHGTKEVHRVKHINGRCSVDRLSRGGYCVWLWQWLLRTFCGYDGCRWCWESKHFK